MQLITRYLGLGIARPALTSTFLLVTLVWLLQSLNFLDYIVNKGLPVAEFIELTLYLVPSLLIILLPLGFLFGCCTKLKNLQDNSELPPLFSAGLSRWQLGRSVLLTAFFASLLTYLVSLWLLPLGMMAFKDLQHRIRHSGGALLVEPGTFNPLGQHLMLYVRERTGPTSLRALMVHDTNNKNRPVTWVAAEGRLEQPEGALPRLVLRNGQRQEISADGSLHIVGFEEHQLDLSQAFGKSQYRWRDAEERLLFELLNQDGLTEKQKNQFYAEFHRRLTWPLLPFGLAALVLLLQLRKQSRRAQTLGPAVLAAVGGLGLTILVIMAHNTAQGGAHWALYAEWGLVTLFPLGTLIYLKAFNR